MSASTWVLSVTISTFWESARHRTLVERADELGEFGFLVGQRALGLVHDAGLGGDFVLGGAQLIAQRLVARFQRENGGGLFAQLHLEPVDGVALLAELGELAGGLGLELLDAHFEAPRRHGEFGAQLVLVGLDFRHRQRRRGFETAHGQAHRAAMDEGNDDEPEQGRDQKSDPEIHDRFDHERRLQLTLPARPNTNPNPGRRVPGQLISLH